MCSKPSLDFLSGRRNERFLAATVDVHDTYSTVQTIFCSHHKKKKNFSYLALRENKLIFEDFILTKQKKAKMKSGIVERASSQRQPKVGITKIASITSNTVPKAQNIYSRSEGKRFIRDLD